MTTPAPARRDYAAELRAIADSIAELLDAPIRDRRAYEAEDLRARIETRRAELLKELP